MTIQDYLSKPATQEAVAELVGVTQPTISNLMAQGKLPREGTLGELVLAYCERLRDQAAGRLGDTLGLDLVQERAALAREQRIGHRRKRFSCWRDGRDDRCQSTLAGSNSLSARDRLPAGGRDAAAIIWPPCQRCARLRATGGVVRPDRPVGRG